MRESDRTMRIEKPDLDKGCGHPHHVGTCASCQRAQLTRWQLQLIQVKKAQPAGRH